MKELIHGFTVGSTATTAYNDTGRLEVGSRADMVVFDHDLYDVYPEKITDAFSIRHLATWVGGRQTFLGLKYEGFNLKLMSNHNPP